MATGQQVARQGAICAQSQANRTRPRLLFPNIIIVATLGSVTFSVKKHPPVSALDHAAIQKLDGWQSRPFIAKVHLVQRWGGSGSPMSLRTLLRTIASLVDQRSCSRGMQPWPDADGKFLGQASFYFGRCQGGPFGHKLCPTPAAPFEPVPRQQQGGEAAEAETPPSKGDGWFQRLTNVVLPMANGSQPDLPKPPHFAATISRTCFAPALDPGCSQVIREQRAKVWLRVRPIKPVTSILQD
jgi:hypothetical protein